LHLTDVALSTRHWNEINSVSNVKVFFVRKCCHGSQLYIYVVGIESSQSSSDILRLRKRFVRRHEEESRVFFAKRQTRLNQQREVCVEGRRKIVDTSLHNQR